MIKRLIQKAAAFSLSAAMLRTASFSANAEDTGKTINNADWNSFVEEKIELDEPPGLAVTLVNGSEVSFKNWGYGNIEEQTPVTEATGS